MELRGLETLERQMSQDLEQLKQRRADAAFSATLAGRLADWAGRAFAIYCIYRTLSVRILSPVTPVTRAHTHCAF
jgi:hypothetical protein